MNWSRPEILDRSAATRLAFRSAAGSASPASARTAINRLLIEAAKSGQRVVRLKGGDPFVFGRGGEEIEALRGAGVAYSVVPGITAGLGAAAQFEVPLTYRREALRITFLTAHKASDAEKVDWSVLTDKNMTIVVYMGMTAAPSIREAVGRRPYAATPVGVFAKATRPDAQAVVGRLEIFPTWSNRSMAVPPFSLSATWSRIPRRGAVQSGRTILSRRRDLQPAGSCRMTSPLRTKNQNHRPVDGDRQPHLGRRRDLSHRRSRAGRRAVADAAIVRTSDEARALLAEADRRRRRRHRCLHRAG